MKALPKLLLALTAVAALSVAYPAKANLITNPGFETGDLTGWTLTGNQTFAITGTFNGVAPHSGNFQAISQAGNSLAQSGIVTTPNSTYTIDFFAALSSFNGSNVTLTVTFGTTVFSHVFDAITGYTEFTFNATAPTSSSSLNFSITGGQTFELLHLDDVSVTPAGVPDGGTTVSLLGCALVGLAALRRFLMG